MKANVKVDKVEVEVDEVDVDGKITIQAGCGDETNNQPERRDLFQLFAWDLTRVSSHTVDVVVGGPRMICDRRRGPREMLISRGAGGVCGPLRYDHPSSRFGFGETSPVGRRTENVNRCSGRLHRVGSRCFIASLGAMLLPIQRLCWDDSTDCQMTDGYVDGLYLRREISWQGHFGTLGESCITSPHKTQHATIIKNVI